VGPATGLLALAVLNKDSLQTGALDRSTVVVSRRPPVQLTTPQYNFEPTQEPCGALNLSMKTTALPTDRFHRFAEIDSGHPVFIVVVVVVT